MAITFCINARKPARVHKEIVHIRLSDFKLYITSLVGNMNSDARVSDIVATKTHGLEC